MQKEAQKASTKSWHPSIGKAGNTSPPRQRDLLNLLIVALRQAAEQAVREQLLPIASVVSLLEKQPGRIFQRLNLYLLSWFSQGSHELMKRYLMDRTLFDDGDVRYEYGLLARTVFPVLSETEQEQWLQWIEVGPDLQAYQERYKQYYQRQPDKEVVMQYANVWRRDWFAEIGDGLKGIWKTRYTALVAELGPTEPEDDKLTTTWGRPANGLLIEELRSMSIDQILSYLQEWQPSNDFMSPSREGLGQLLTTLISEKPEQFADDADRFEGNDPIYINAVIQGFTEATRNHRSFDWEHVLNLCHWIVRQRYMLTENDTVTTDDPIWAWTSQMVAHLLLSATEAQPPVLSCSLNPKIWDILKPLTDDPDPSQKDEVANEDQDPVMEYASSAVNSIRGTALHAVINYGLWLKRQAEQEGGKENIQNLHILSQVQAVLKCHLDQNVDASLAVRSVYGQHLVNLVALDRQWTTEHLTLLFPREDHQRILRVATWNTYVVFCDPYSNILSLLHDEYAAAIERLDTAMQSKSIVESPDYQLGEHLIRFYWSGLISLVSPESLLTRFFLKAPAALRGQVLAFIGRAFYHTKEDIPSEIIERCQRLLEWRISEAQKAPSTTEYTYELTNFGGWFRADVCPPEWGLHQLESILILAGNIDLSYAVVERLARCVELYPDSVMRCLAMLIKCDTMMWTMSIWEKAVRPILTYALQQTASETQQWAKSVISSLALHGMTDFLDLLPKGE